MNTLINEIVLCNLSAGKVGTSINKRWQTACCETFQPLQGRGWWICYKAIQTTVERLIASNFGQNLESASAGTHAVITEATTIHVHNEIKAQCIDDNQHGAKKPRVI